jgi:hypothetical protein
LNIEYTLQLEVEELTEKRFALALTKTGNFLFYKLSRSKDPHPLQAHLDSFRYGYFCIIINKCNQISL